MRSLAALPLVAVLLSGCADGVSPFKRAATTPESETSASPESVKIVDRDVEAPEVFQVTDQALWDGRPSLGGVWVASPDATDPERVILRNPANGKFVIGALFRREAFNPGPKLQVSSDAADALGLLAGAPAKISVTALRREEVAAQTDATKPILDANEGIETETLAADAAAAIAAAPAGKTGDKTGDKAGDKPAATAAAPAATAVAPAPKAGPAIPVVSGKQGGTLQIGIFSVEENANRAAATLKKAGIEAAVRKETTQGKTWWSVTAKGAGDRAAFLAKIKGLGFKDAYFVKG
ncbi:SPOR domain-containing protein [Gemmobacter straminiformis]|uniref:SPOR domain-containing protein n=2 Tax=Paragemmobacter straminiformis TaxID=2045119 RepID=A0A842ID28_9RHOB|nr:SPOR domain-containing protein [Gemmobacter straminiformis]